MGPPGTVGWGAAVVDATVAVFPATTEYVGFAGVAVGEPVFVGAVWTPCMDRVGPLSVVAA